MCQERMLASTHEAVGLSVYCCKSVRSISLTIAAKAYIIMPYLTFWAVRWIYVQIFSCPFEKKHVIAAALALAVLSRCRLLRQILTTPRPRLPFCRRKQRLS